MNDTQAKPTVMITGCSGLIGSALIDALQDTYQVIGLDLEAPAQLPPGVHWIQCDLTEDDSVGAALAEVASLAGNRLASVIHLAAYYDFSGEPSPLYQKLTVEGTRRLLRAMQTMEVEQFVFTSTLLVMKSLDDNNQRLTESSPLDAEWEYPQSKVRAEEVIAQERGAIPAVVLRMAGIFDENCNSLPISQQVKRIYEKELESHFFPGDASHGQPFIHVQDLLSCFQQVIAKRKALQGLEVFLISEDDLMSYGQLQDALGKLIHGEQWTTMRIPKPVAKAGAWVKEKMSSDDDQPFIRPWMVDLADQNYPVDLSKSRKLLDWRPQHTLRETLPAMVKFLKRDPQAFYEFNGLPVSEEVRKA